MPALAGPLAAPIYSGSGVSALVPDVYDVAIGGRPYMVDWKHADKFIRRSIPLLKPQVDDSGNVSERSLNPEEFARSAAESWHHGAGQTHLDRTDSDPYRYRTSKGVDPWTRNQLGLLPATASKRASAATNLELEVAGSYLYVADDQQVHWTADITAASPSWTSAVIHNGEAAQAVKSLASDGATVFAALGSNGIHQTAAGAATSTHHSDLSCTLLGYAKGRLMAANGNSIYNVTASGAAPSALYTHPTATFTWVAFADAGSHIYAAGYSGDKSLVYRTAVLPDGTALGVPVVAGQLPDGEIVRALQGNVDGTLSVGSDLGWRVAELDAAGNLEFGPLVATGEPVLCFEPQAEFVWFGLSNFDATSTGLGRFTRTALNDGVPAYASDLMSAGQGAVLSLATFQDRRVFAVSGLGVYAQTAALVASGSIDSGLVTYGLPDDKVSAYLDVRHQALSGSIVTALAVDGGAFADIGSSATALSTSVTLPTGQRTGETFEVRHTLAGGTGPVLTRWTLEANPAPGRGETFVVPLLLFELVDGGGGPQSVDVAVEKTHLLDLENSGAVTAYQTGEGTFSVIVDEHQFAHESYTKDRRAFNGTWLVELRRPRQRS